MKKYLEYLTQVTQGQVLNLTQAEQGLEFVFSLFCVSTQSTEQMGLSSHWYFPSPLSP